MEEETEKETNMAEEINASHKDPGSTLNFFIPST
jgi:hypothetical protein